MGSQVRTVVFVAALSSHLSLGDYLRDWLAEISCELVAWRHQPSAISHQPFAVLVHERKLNGEVGRVRGHLHGDRCAPVSGADAEPTRVERIPLYRGSEGPQVTQLQRQLKYGDDASAGHLLIDGPATAAALNLRTVPSAELYPPLTTRRTDVLVTAMASNSVQSLRIRRQLLEVSRTRTMRASSPGSYFAVDFAEQCPVRAAASHSTVTRGAAGR